MLRRVADLSQEERVTIERLLQRAVSDEEWIDIRTVREPAYTQSPLSDDERREVSKKLDEYFAQVRANRADVTPEEEEEIINEALRSTRPNYRPIY